MMVAGLNEKSHVVLPAIVSGPRESMIGRHVPLCQWIHQTSLTNKRFLKKLVLNLLTSKSTFDESLQASSPPGLSYYGCSSPLLLDLHWKRRSEGLRYYFNH